MSGGEVGLGNVGSVLWNVISDCPRRKKACEPNRYLVGFVGGSGGNLALVTGSELGEVAVVVALPTGRGQLQVVP